jgi:addiction module RelE/StbE family toxin
VQEKLKKQIALLAEDPRHPSHQTKPIQGAPGIYEARVDIDYRMTYQRDADDTLVLRVVGKHVEALKKP